MPVVRIDMWEGRDKETKRKLIQSVSKAVADSLGIEVDRIEIILNDVPKDNWGKNGEQASEL
ncbi:MAG: 2-hydroxymuconate tautomerase family protein [Nanoarchaeota archaeon]|nr:2-hydroxymuconate tautomerase family protein [Nanoarchaeota archaeon]